jgi:hypothetical protein
MGGGTEGWGVEEASGTCGVGCCYWAGPESPDIFLMDPGMNGPTSDGFTLFLDYYYFGNCTKTVTCEILEILAFQTE